MISFESYAKIANNYCICYFGQSDEYLVQLRLLKPILEREFPDLNLYIGCKDDKSPLLKESKRVLKLSELKIRRHDFAHITEIRCNGNTHPVEDFIARAHITNFAIPRPPAPETTKCVIITKGAYPTKPLEQLKIEKLKRMATARQMDWHIDGDIKAAGLVMGVESVSLFEAAAQGSETILVPTGVGTRLFSNMFPSQSVVHV